MAIMDARNEFADAVAVTAAAGTQLIGNTIDLGPAHVDPGNGEQIYLVITVDTEIATAGAAGSVRFDLVSDAQPAIATDGSATVHYTTGNFTTGAAGVQAPLKAGAKLAVVVVPLEGKTYERYLGILCITATAATTTGRINAFLTLDPPVWAAYPQGVV